MLDNMSSIILTQIYIIFVNCLLFWHRVSFIFFYLIKNVTIRCENAQKERKANVSFSIDNQFGLIIKVSKKFRSVRVQNLLCFFIYPVFHSQ